MVSTVSEKLASQVKSILSALGVRANLRKEKGKKYKELQQKDAWCVDFQLKRYSEIYDWMEPLLREKGFSMTANYLDDNFEDYYIHVLRTKEELPEYNDVLFDLSVEVDNSFVANGTIVHNCPDFYYTFSYYNWEQGALWGTKARPYKRLTLTRPPRNPLHVVGFCKHGWNAVQSLQTRGIVATGG